MGNLSKANFFDAGVNPPRTRVHVSHDGTRRVEKLPNGLVERWVDAQGNIVWQQIVPSGVPATLEGMDARRAEIRRRPGKWLEFHKCPLTTGALGPDDFPEGTLQRICRPESYGTDKPCVHVQRIVGERQELQHEKRATRDAALNAEKLAREARELEQLQSQRELNANLAKIVNAAAANLAGNGVANERFTPPSAPQAQPPASAGSDTPKQDKPKKP